MTNLRQQLPDGVKLWPPDDTICFGNELHIGNYGRIFFRLRLALASRDLILVPADYYHEKPLLLIAPMMTHTRRQLYPQCLNRKLIQIFDDSAQVGTMPRKPDAVWACSPMLLQLWRKLHALHGYGNVDDDWSGSNIEFDVLPYPLLAKQAGDDSDLDVHMYCQPIAPIADLCYIGDAKAERLEFLLELQVEMEKRGLTLLTNIKGVPGRLEQYRRRLNRDEMAAVHQQSMAVLVMGCSGQSDLFTSRYAESALAGRPALYGPNCLPGAKELTAEAMASQLLRMSVSEAEQRRIWQESYDFTMRLLRQS